MATEKQIAANQANAQSSTGPRTDEGKQRSSLNALKSGLTGRTILLPSEDKAAYERHILHFHTYYEPIGDEEEFMVQRMADTQWRIDRCAALESNLYALGQVEFAALFPDETEEVRRALLQAHTFRAYQKEFRNLNIQEGRLQRTLQRDGTLYDKLQQAREQIEQEHYARELQLRQAALAYSAALREGKPFNTAEFGFEFSLAELAPYLPRPAAKPAPQSAESADVKQSLAA